MSLSPAWDRWQSVRQAIYDNQSFVISTHINPDGDAIGSQMALYFILKRLGKSAALINQDPVPANCRFLDPDQRIEVFSESSHAPIIRAADVIIVVDTNSWERIGTVGRFIKTLHPTAICIDHHLEEKSFATYEVIDENACAAAEMIYDLVLSMSLEIDLDIARSIYTGILTDTGSFRFPRTSANTHAIVSHLLPCGIQPEHIYGEVYEVSSLAAIQLLGRALHHLQTGSNGQMAWLVVTQDMFAETGASEDDTDGFVNYTMRLKGVKIGILFRESVGSTKISIRSKGSYNVGAFANIFGGGGHINAAGIRIKEPIGAVTEKIVSNCRAYFFPENS